MISDTYVRESDLRPGKCCLEARLRAAEKEVEKGYKAIPRFSLTARRILVCAEGIQERYACPELIGLPILRLFFESIPIPLRLDNLTTQTAFSWIAAHA